jgi:hypothetical protein
MASTKPNYQSLKLLTSSLPGDIIYECVDTYGGFLICHTIK